MHLTRLLMFTLIFSFGLPVMADTKKEAALSAEAKEAGFIALSESRMNWNDAVAFCKSHDGRLPSINNSDLWDGDDPPGQSTLIDGFGYGHRPWGELGLPFDHFWTGAVHTLRPDLSWVVIVFSGGVIILDALSQSLDYRVACVP